MTTWRNFIAHGVAVRFSGLRFWYRCCRFLVFLKRCGLRIIGLFGNLLVYSSEAIGLNSQALVVEMLETRPEASSSGSPPLSLGNLQCC
jgi:hypothetical protein